MTTQTNPEPDQDRAPAEVDLVDALVQLSFAVQQVLTETGAAHELSVTQLRLLAILRDRTVAMSEVARYLGLDRSSITGLVQRGERRGLVQRVPSPDDGRGVLVEATADGRALAGEVEDQVRSRLLALTAPLTPSERARLTALADRVVGVV